MHAISSYRGNRPTNKQTSPQTNKHTNIQDRLQYTAPLSLARSVTMTPILSDFSFQDNPRWLVPECLHSGFYWSQGWWRTVVTTGAIRRAKLQSNCHYQQTDTQFFTGQRSFLSPNQQCQSIEGEKYHIPRTCSPQAIPGFSTLVLTTKALGYFGGKGWQSSSQPSDSSAMLH